MTTANGWFGQWQPGIGDPTLLGWTTVVAYFAAAYWCARSARVAGPSRARRAWVLLTVVLAMLGMNKQLDLQTLLTEIGRKWAHEQSWYVQRANVQVLFITGIAILGVAAIALFSWLIRGLGSPLRWASLGVLFIFVYVVIRAASFHHVDRFIHSNILGLRANWILELGGLLCVIWSARRGSRLTATN